MLIRTECGGEGTRGRAAREPADGRPRHEAGRDDPLITSSVRFRELPKPLAPDLDLTLQDE
jgi:hypothetical protein